VCVVAAVETAENRRDREEQGGCLGCFCVFVFVDVRRRFLGGEIQGLETEPVNPGRSVLVEDGLLGCGRWRRLREGPLLAEVDGDHGAGTVDSNLLSQDTQ